MREDFFSKIDLSDAYLQIEVDEKCRKFLTHTMVYTVLIGYGQIGI